MADEKNTNVKENDNKRYFVGTVKYLNEINTKNGLRYKTTVHVPARDVAHDIDVITKDKPAYATKDGNAREFAPGDGIKIPGKITQENMGLRPGQEYTNNKGEKKMGNPTLWTNTKDWERDAYHDQREKEISGTVKQIGPSERREGYYDMHVVQDFERSYDPDVPSTPSVNAYVRMSQSVYDHLKNAVHEGDTVKMKVVQKMTHDYARDEKGDPIIKLGEDGQEHHVYNNDKVVPSPTYTLPFSKNVEIVDNSISREIEADHAPKKEQAASRAPREVQR